MGVKFTPGPWVVSTERRVEIGCDWHWIGPEDWHTRTARCVGYFGEEEEQEANANLIAAAPDLYEALDALFKDYKQLADSGDAGNWSLEELEVGKKALAALAKARGES